ncbi:Retrovirus-related Pol polyprotein, partial [Mucuna pruriens]
MGRIVSALVKHEDASVGSQQILPKKCQDPGIFFVPCTIHNYTLADAIMDSRASINVMPALVYKSLNFRDLEPTRMEIQLANRSFVQTLGMLEDVLIQVNEFIFPSDFYELDMEDEEPGKGSALILGRPFLMMARTKIDLYVRTLSMEFGDNFVEFKIFDALEHLTKDHSIFSMDTIEGLVEKYVQIDTCSGNLFDFVEISDVLNKSQQVEAESNFGQLSSHSGKVGQPTPSTIKGDVSAQSQTTKLKSFSEHLKYAYLGDHEQFPMIIANNLKQENNQLDTIRPSKDQPLYLYAQNSIGRGSPTNKALVEKTESDYPRRVTIIYPISDSQWVSPIQVVSKKLGMIVVKNRQDEMVLTRIQNSWRVCIDYRKLNHSTRKDHFSLPFLDQVLEKIARKSHFCFLDGYMQIHIALVDQHKTTFTFPFNTFSYTRMSFGLCNALSTFQRCMISIFSNLLEDCMEVFMDDFIVYAESFEACLDNLSKILCICIQSNLVLNFEKCHFMVTDGIVLGHLILARGIKVDKAKVDVISSLSNPASMRKVRSFLGHPGDSSRISTRSPCLYLRCYRRTPMWKLSQSAPILQEPNWEFLFKLMCNASNLALGTVLEQRVGK